MKTNKQSFVRLHINFLVYYISHILECRIIGLHMGAHVESDIKVLYIVSVTRHWGRQVGRPRHRISVTTIYVS